MFISNKHILKICKVANPVRKQAAQCDIDLIADNSFVQYLARTLGKFQYLNNDSIFYIV